MTSETTLLQLVGRELMKKVQSALKIRTCNPTFMSIIGFSPAHSTARKERLVEISLITQTRQMQFVALEDELHNTNHAK